MRLDAYVADADSLSAKYKERLHQRWGLFCIRMSGGFVRTPWFDKTRPKERFGRGSVATAPRMGNTARDNRVDITKATTAVVRKADLATPPRRGEKSPKAFRINPAP